MVDLTSSVILFLSGDIWPSDHLVVGARLRVTAKSKDESNGNHPTPINHPVRCACGCVPNILSLFEMAELRKKAREATSNK